MNRIIIILLMQLSLIPLKTSAQTMQDILRNMPDSIMPLLSGNNVLDFIDYLASNMKAEVNNNLAGKSEMTELTENYAAISMTPNSSIQMKLLPFGNEKIIAIVQSVSADSKYTDSRINFYKTSWESIPTGQLFTYKEEDLFMAMKMTAANNDIVISFSNPLELDKDTKKKEPVTLKWNGTKFE